jgi:hypothetical protein
MGLTSPPGWPPCDGFASFFGWPGWPDRLGLQRNNRGVCPSALEEETCP